ncbi:BTAD domain-containing putative transcriptional regulator [Nonomuraea sp. NPDC049709]|uniref:AfsR/SARP family transcriptional regulator n=1 Tax=Nonomuraea sp. NPDC049709 TaxID=3154736 RepID=UPI00342E2ADF
MGARPPGNPANALQAKVSQLRRVVGRDRVAYQAPGYLLRLGPADEVDADRFLALVAGARSAGPVARAALLAEALELWRGPAYADFADEEFARAGAHRLNEQRLAVVEEQAETRLAAGDDLLLTGELAALVARHPLRERLRAVQLRALYLAGRQGEALASYEELRHRLADELGVDPSPELAALHQAILRQDASLGPPPGVPDRLVSNLPAQLTALVGRGPALEEVDRLLGGARLVTLIGPGGVGKTRVAVEAATRIAAPEDSSRGARFPDGVWLVELADQRGGVADLAQAVAATLGLSGDVPAGPPHPDHVPTSPPRPGYVPAGTPGPGTAGAPADRLAAALRERRILLVLDNCEQVVEPAAELVDLLLRAAPGANVLATSREPLGLAGETVYLVEPLQPADAIRLFTERASASAGRWTMVRDVKFDRHTFPGTLTELVIADLTSRLGQPLTALDPSDDRPMMWS